MPDHYATLGVPKDADASTIRRAYRRKAARAHPDRADGDHRAMIAVNRAYDTLSDPARRARYDQTGQDQAATPLDVKARGLIMQLMMQIIDQAPDHLDIIETLRAQIRVNQQNVRKAAADLRGKVGKFERRRKRLKYTGNERNFLADLLDQQIAGMTHKAAEMEADANAVGNRALELLAAFAYDPEVPATEVFTVLFANTTTSQWR